jgi:hypothetical protein
MPGALACCRRPVHPCSMAQPNPLAGGMQTSSLTQRHFRGQRRSGGSPMTRFAARRCPCYPSVIWKSSECRESASGATLSAQLFLLAFVAT